MPASKSSRARRTDPATAMPTAAEIARAVRAVQQLGLSVAEVRLAAGKRIEVVTAPHNASAADAALAAWARGRGGAD